MNNLFVHVEPELDLEAMTRILYEAPLSNVFPRMTAFCESRGVRARSGHIGKGADAFTSSADQL